MQLIRKLHWLFAPYMAPADDNGGGGGAVDRGDDFTPTDGVDDEVDPTKGDPANSDDEDAKKLAAEAEAAKKAAEDAKGEKDGDKGAKDEDDKKRKETRIPLSRHKEILDREREAREALETRLKQYEKGQVVADVNEEITKAEDKLLTAEKEYTKLITDGEHDKAAAKMAEIRRMERSINEKKSEMRVAAAQAQAIETVRYDTTVDRIEEAYPALRPGSDEFDKDKVGEVMEMKDAFQLKGYTPSQALQKAVKYVMGAPTTRKQETAIEVQAKTDKDKVEAERKRLAAEKAAEANGKQPPNASKVGLDSDKAGGRIDAKSVLKMSQDDFAKLDEETLAKMRGDVIA